jgi:hypothetical protein
LLSRTQKPSPGKGSSEMLERPELPSIKGREVDSSARWTPRACGSWISTIFSFSRLLSSSQLWKVITLMR